MRKWDEIAYFDTLRRLPSVSQHTQQPGLHAIQDTALAMGIPMKRAYYLLDKWSDRGWWDYGVSLRTGWFTRQAPVGLLEHGTLTPFDIAVASSPLV